MQGLGSFTDFIKESKKDCNSVKSIKDINDQYIYEDKKGGGASLEWDLISCGSDGFTNGYNELQRFYDNHIHDKYKGLALNNITMKALCKCCKELSHKNRTHESFKKCVGKKFGIIL